MIIFTGIYPLLETLALVPQGGRYEGYNNRHEPSSCDIVLCATAEWVGDEESGRGVKYVYVGILVRDDIIESV